MTEHALTKYDDPATGGAVQVFDRMKPVRNVLAPTLDDEELKLFAMVANRSGLDPFAKQLYAIKRQGRVTFQTGIDGYRSIAGRTGQFEGSSDPEFGDWVEAPFMHPEWCRIVVYRYQNGRLIEQPGTAWWDEYYPGEKGKIPTVRDTGYMWLTKPRVMLSKVAEAIALRKAFPYLLADLYVREEMEQAGPPEHAGAVEAAAQPTARDRIAARKAALTEPVEVVEEAVVREDPGPCPATSPYEGAAPCALNADHEGNHRTADRESWT